ncbi:hypothetical protein FQR65_LT00638 [Abscondita terminalis]|nr:hypothetical protein FQR65_LT00638 [Abscondita terminalis]
MATLTGQGELVIMSELDKKLFEIMLNVEEIDNFNIDEEMEWSDSCICEFNTLKFKVQNCKLALTNTSESFMLWKEPPFPIYMSVYLFNWTNAQEVIRSKWNNKPKLKECGPYVFSQHHVRVNVTWNRNNTVTYQQKRIWKFIPSMSKGSMDDIITSVNPISAVRFERFPRMFQFAINNILKYFDEQIYKTKPVREWLFDGYHDRILTDISELAHFFGIEFNFDRMGWFYNRNNSAAYEGTFTIYTGIDDISLLGMMNKWNGLSTTNAYEGPCSLINGSSGELYPPIRSERQDIFLADVCGSITLQHDDYQNVNGIIGHRFVSTDYTFDNGSKYSEQACYVNNAKIPAGVRNVAKCKFDAPAFLSLPHFYLGDSSYVKAVNGLRPNKTLHEMRAVFEPRTGIPLDVDVMLQLNLFLNNIPGLSLFRNVKPVYMPVIWFKESGTIPENYSTTVKILLAVINGGPYFMCGLICLGTLMAIIGLYLLYGTDRAAPLPSYNQFENEEKTE